MEFSTLSISYQVKYCQFSVWIKRICLSRHETLYEEIIFLERWFKGKYVVENVIPYYEPLIKAEEIDRHLFWANFKIGAYEIQNKKQSHEKAQVPYLEKFLGYDLKNYKGKNKRQILRNCVLPETGLHILNRAMGIIKNTNVNQSSLF